MLMRSAGRTATGLVVAAAAAALACGGGDAGGEVDRDAAAAREGDARTRQASPDTTASGLWSYLQEVDYRDEWNYYPGKGELYEGQEPHGMLLTTYVNGPARRAVRDSAGRLPDGAVVVKENYRPDSTLAAITVMYKERGYDPEHSDWYWVKYLPDGSVDREGEAAGRVPGCIQCHGGKADNDYIMTSSIAGGEDGR